MNLSVGGDLGVHFISDLGIHFLIMSGVSLIASFFFFYFLKVLDMLLGNAFHLKIKHVLHLINY